MVTPSLRKKVAAALKFLHENPTRVEKMLEQTNELEKRQLKNLAR